MFEAVTQAGHYSVIGIACVDAPSRFTVAEEHCVIRSTFSPRLSTTTRSRYGFVNIVFQIKVILIGEIRVVPLVVGHQNIGEKPPGTAIAHAGDLVQTRVFDGPVLRADVLQAVGRDIDIAAGAHRAFAIEKAAALESEIPARCQ